MSPDRTSPTVTVAELELLSRFGELVSEGKLRYPSASLRSECMVSKATLRGVRLRLERKFGRLFGIGPGGALVPNDTGRSLGAAYRLFEELALAAADPNTDQASLLRMIQDLHDQAINQNVDGTLYRATP